MNSTQPQWRAWRRITPAAAVAAIVLLSAVLAASSGAVTPRAGAAPGGIANIKAFLEQCPTNDPLYSQFRADFEIRREGVVVGAIPCTEPVSAMSNAQYTDELIALQAVRTIYYMEGGRNVPYPWTSGSMYDWMKAKIGGIDIRGGSYCCTNFNGKWYIAINAQSFFERDAAREWRGLSARISLIGHETRHVTGYPHVGGCPLFPTQSFGCDQTYDIVDLSPYAIQWWLNSEWLSGGINVGYGCLEWNEVDTIATSHLNRANNDYGKRFVEQSPPALEMPSEPGGACPGGTPGETPPSTQTPASTPTPSVAATATPIPTATPSPTVPPTAPPQRVQGDVDCSGLVTSIDALMLMRFSAQLNVSQSEPCPDIGGGAVPVWGDVDCSGAVNSSDALKALRFLASLTVSQTEPCPDIGAFLP